MLLAAKAVSPSHVMITMLLGELDELGAVARPAPKFRHVALQRPAEAFESLAARVGPGPAARLRFAPRRVRASSQ